MYVNVNKCKSQEADNFKNQDLMFIKLDFW